MKTAVIVGVGALGSHVAQFLRNEAALRIVDFDRVESKNILAQFHGKPSVGKGKVQSLQQSMNFLFGLKVEGIPHKLVADNAKEILGKADLVIDCLDNGASRTVVQQYVRGAGIPCLHGALAADGAYGRVVWDESFVIDFEPGTGAPTCEGGEHLPFIAVVSAYIARAAQEFLRNDRRIGFEVSPAGVIRT